MKRLPGGEDCAVRPRASPFAGGRHAAGRAAGAARPARAAVPGRPRRSPARCSERGGWPALRAAWTRPPRSTEQVLHPEKYFAGEAPLAVDPGPPPAGGTLVHEGVLGEAFVAHAAGRGHGRGARGLGRRPLPRVGRGRPHAARVALRPGTRRRTRASSRPPRCGASRASHGPARERCAAPACSGAGPGWSACPRAVGKDAVVLVSSTHAPPSFDAALKAEPAVEGGSRARPAAWPPRLPGLCHPPLLLGEASVTAARRAQGSRRRPRPRSVLSKRAPAFRASAAAGRRPSAMRRAGVSGPAALANPLGA